MKPRSWKLQESSSTNHRCSLSNPKYFSRSTPQIWVSLAWMAPREVTEEVPSGREVKVGPLQKLHRSLTSFSRAHETSEECKGQTFLREGHDICSVRMFFAGRKVFYADSAAAIASNMPVSRRGQVLFTETSTVSWTLHVQCGCGSIVASFFIFA